MGVVDRVKREEGEKKRGKRWKRREGGRKKQRGKRVRGIKVNEN